MRKMTLISALIGAILMLTTAVHAQESTPESTAGNYAEVNGLNLYYEVYGEGEPLIPSWPAAVTCTPNTSCFFGQATTDSLGATTGRGRKVAADAVRLVLIDSKVDCMLILSCR